jgi:predicted CXXCH cytochrome family protein
MTLMRVSFRTGSMIMIKIKNKKHFSLIIVFMLVICTAPAALYSKSFRETSHGDRNNLPKGCQSCHEGHGVFNTPMLSSTKDIFCFRCHGNSLSREKLRQDGFLSSDVFLQDIQREFEKSYRHPIEITGIHQYKETLPETDPSIPRHAECVDCHHHHYVTKDNKFLGLKGTNVDGARVPSVINEYEVCFNCHSYSANLPSDQTNKATLFNISNPSYHPMIGQGKNNYVPSLQAPLTTSSLIKCTDCHGNDDPFGPKGVHGSNYEHLLKKKFTVSDGSEGTVQYELCYSCHARTSILSNEGFPLHNLHVAIVGTSCRTCHNPHGSIQYSHLIDLNNTSIGPSSSGSLEYRTLGPRAGECFLTCHGKDHNPGSYPTTTQSLSIQKQLLKK